MAKQETSHWTANRARTFWLCASLTLVLLPHVGRIPFWVSIGFVLLAYWRIEHVVRGVRLPSRWTRVLFSVGIVFGVYFSFGTLFGRSAGIAALAVLAGMKLLETDTLRDAYATIFLGFFLVITNFLYSQSIPTGIYMIFVVAVITATLIAVNSDSETMDIKDNLLRASKLLSHAVPLMLILFVLFPRIPGPLWGLPKDATSAVSGLSDSMSPGAISQLGLSSAVAFRVEFDGPPPRPSQLYWRGPVFTNTDGKTWRAGASLASRTLPLIQPRGAARYYTITMEPHEQRWIFGLDVIGNVPAGFRMTRDYELLADRKVNERRQVRLRSFPNASMLFLGDVQREQALTLPEGAHPRTRELAERWRAQSSRPHQIVEAALRHFRTQPFHYTLQPPALLGDSVDQFLFESQRGFCEHFASAFTVLMRAAGIPARVVTGYQGGEVNPLGDYIIVRQRDAHAWAEVWLEDRGWVRVDPTAAVSPVRIERGMSAAIAPEISPSAFVFQPGGAAEQALRRLRLGWDSVNNTWNQWVLGYGARKQHDLMSFLGLDSDWRNLLMWLVFSVLAVLLPIGLWMLRRRGSSDPVVNAYDRYCRKLAKVGFVRAEHEGPVDFAHRVVEQRPDLENSVQRITHTYVSLRYAHTKGLPHTLIAAVSAFRPTKFAGQTPVR